MHMAQLFAGQSEISVQLSSPAGALQDAMITVSVDGSIIDERETEVGVESNVNPSEGSDKHA